MTTKCIFYVVAKKTLKAMQPPIFAISFASGLQELIGNVDGSTQKLLM